MVMAGIGFSWRMAFTNYLMQTIICTLFFMVMALVILAAVVTAIILFCCRNMVGTNCILYYWLRYYEYGPVEWLWRWLIYGKRFLITKKQDKQTLT
jgi:uncharacterized protein